MNMKRIIAFALMALLLCLLPVWAMADEYANEGSCGDNATWSYDSAKKEFTISGTGAIDDHAFYSNGNGIWNNAETLVIGEGITAIGEYAFACVSYDDTTGFCNMESAFLPKSLTIIGENAFLYCSSLTSVTIPDSVKSIGYRAFDGCTSLTSVTIPDSVESIGWGAFDGCTSLTSVTIPDSVESIGEGTFYGCSSLTSVTIPDSVESIGDAAFDGCTSLTSVNVPCSWHKNPLYKFGDSVTLDFPSEWTVTKPATTTETGMEQRVCTACGHIFETREIPKLPELPTTGDDSNVILWSALAFVGVIGMTMIVRKRKEA